MNTPPRRPPWGPPGAPNPAPGGAVLGQQGPVYPNQPPAHQGYGGPQPGYSPQSPPGYGGPQYPSQPNQAQPRHHPSLAASARGVSSADGDEDDVDRDMGHDDAPIADSPSWVAIGVLAGIVLLGAAIGAGVGFLVEPPDTIWLGAILGGFAAGMFGVAGIGWSYRNMDWIPMSYEERTLVLVLGILAVSSPLALHILHPGH